MSATYDLSAVAAPGLTIDGETVSSPGRIEVINPATAEVFIAVPDAGAAELDRATGAARRAAGAWRATPLAQRQDCLLRLVAVIREHLDELALLVTLEQGKPLANARGEITSGLRYCERYAAMQVPVEVVRDDESERIEVHRVPVGVVGAITAWNYPMLLALWKIAPALMAGNPVIVKPSPYTPVATLRLGELAQPVLPPGVLQVLSGGDELGRALTTHPLIAKISFTGSERTGKAIMAASAPTLKRLTLELGGNDAGIVLDDIDPAAIAAGLYWGGLSNCGQVCAGLKRLYVPERLAAEVEDALAQVAATVVVGDGTRDGVDMGPIQNKMQFDRVEALTAAAQSGGAEIYFRGEVPGGPGYFHPVTLVRRATDEMALVAEEQFGPVLPVLAYRDLDEAVARANASDLGLGASVWSSDEPRAVQVAARLQAGTVWVNQHPMLSPDVPFGGVKQSGLGVESSLHGLLAYTDISVLRVKR
ncbi:MAG: aldehyde dehydrogenase family protein [Streptosporangiaceae bacterium]